MDKMQKKVFMADEKNFSAMKTIMIMRINEKSFSASIRIRHKCNQATSRASTKRKFI
jgi:hypothetical protein